MSLFTTWNRTRLAMPTLRTRGISHARSEQTMCDGRRDIKVAHAQRRAARSEIEFELIALDLEEGWVREEALEVCDYQEVLDDISFYDSVSDEELDELEMAHFRHKYGLEDWDDSDPNALPVE